MEILSIGNSFSDDAQRYLHHIAKSDGVEMSTYNLYIGGCSLERHYRNMLSNERAYDLQMNGESTGFSVSLKEALINREWDIITLQQVSHRANDYDTYQPYLSKIAEYVRLHQPKVKIAFHETWAYEEESQRLCDEMGYQYSVDMFKDIEKTVKKAAQVIDADFIIQSGAVMQRLAQAGLKVYRDTFHASLGLGRYALGLLWYTTLTGNNVDKCNFSDFDEAISPTEIELVSRCVSEMNMQFKQ